MQCRIVFFHGALGSPADTEWLTGQKRFGQILAPRLAVADSWSAEMERLAGLLQPMDVLVGYSLGARVALGVAITYGRPIHRLVLISGHPGLTSDTERQTRRCRDAMWCKRLIEDPTVDFLDDWYQQDVFTHDPSEVLWTLRRERASIDRVYAERVLRILSIAEQPDYRPVLPTLGTRTLLVCGELDHKYVGLAREMVEWIPQVELRIVPTAGHVVHRSHPQCVLAAMR